MPGTDPTRNERKPRSTAWQTALTLLQEAEPPFIHYQDGNNRDDIPLRFTVTMLCEPGRPMLTLVDDEELAQRRERRAPRPS